MTNELEKKFFETFGIEPINVLHNNFEDCPYNQEHLQKFCFECFMKPCIYFKTEYPTITDTKYLELMCIFSDYIDTTKKDIQELKNYILEEFITNQAGFSDEELIKIRALFKGE